MAGFKLRVPIAFCVNKIGLVPRRKAEFLEETFFNPSIFMDQGKPRNHVEAEFMAELAKLSAETVMMARTVFTSYQRKKAR